MRRANGSGSVYKMTHKPLRKPCRAVITIGEDEEGRMIRKTVGTFRTARETLEFLKNYKGDPKTFNYQDITFGQCFKWMMADKVRRGNSKSSIDNYKLAEKRLTELMDTPICEIRLVHLQRIIDDNKTLSRSAIDKIVAAMSGTFTAAIKNDIEVKDYSKYVVRPPAEERNIHKPYTPEEILTLWQNQNEGINKLKLIYIYTGMRPRELINLRVEDTHLKEGYVIGGSKTKSGKNRVIPIAKCILPFMFELINQARFKHHETLYGVIGQYEKLIRHWKKDGHLPHDGRHTFATMASNADIKQHIIKLIIGHSIKDVTEGTYTHKTIQQLVDAVELLPTQKNLLPVEQRLSNK